MYTEFYFTIQLSESLDFRPLRYKIKAYRLFDLQYIAFFCNIYDTILKER